MLLWASLPLRTAGLVILQMLLLVLASAGDGIMSLMATGVFLLPSTALLLVTGYQAVMRGHWISAGFAALPGFAGIILGLLGLSAVLSG